MIFLSNLLIGQFTSSYRAVYKDLLSFAYMRRGLTCIEVMPLVPKRRWERVRDSLRLDDRLEFNEGDLGLDGGIQRLELASANPTPVDRIRRFGGSTCPTAPWPKEDVQVDSNGDEDRFSRLERVLQKTLKRIGATSSSASIGFDSGASESSAGASM